METKEDKQLEEQVTEDNQTKEVYPIEKFWMDNMVKTFIVFFGFGISLYMYPSISGKICALITLVPTCQLVYRSIKAVIGILKMEK